MGIGRGSVGISDIPTSGNTELARLYAIGNEALFRDSVFSLGGTNPSLGDAGLNIFAEVLSGGDPLQGLANIGVGLVGNGAVQFGGAVKNGAYFLGENGLSLKYGGRLASSGYAALDGLAVLGIKLSTTGGRASLLGDILGGVKSGASNDIINISGYLDQGYGLTAAAYHGGDFFGPLAFEGVTAIGTGGVGLAFRGARTVSYLNPEAIGINYGIKQMDKLGYDLLPVDLSYRGNQGLDNIFRNRETGSFAIVEHKHGLGVGDLKTWGYRQGTYDYNVDRLYRYLEFGDGTHNQLAGQLITGLRNNEVQSFATFARGNSTRYIPQNWIGGRGTYEIYFGK